MKETVSTVVAASGSALMCAVPALAQAPATAQVWDVRFVVDSTGPFAAGPTATQVGITMFARVGILPNTSSSTTTNLGIYRLGGAIVQWSFLDSTAGTQGIAQGVVDRGRTADIDGRLLFDTDGQGLAGYFAAFRGSFNPQVPPLYLGANTEPNNGVLFNPPSGPVGLTQMIGARASNYGSDGSGPVGAAAATVGDPVSLVGDLAPVYRLYYVPNQSLSHSREIQVSVTGLSARYAYGLSTFGGLAGGAAVPLPDQTFTFLVPAPGAAGLLGFAASVTARRRRG